MYNWYITRISASPGDTLIGVERGNPTPLLMIKIKLKLNSLRRHLMNGSDSEPIDCQIPTMSAFPQTQFYDTMC